MVAEVKFEPSGVSGLIPTGTYLFDAARRMGIELEDECGRQGECDDCAVEIIQGGEFLSALTKAEIEQLDESRRAKGERLACQAKIEQTGEIVVKTKKKKKSENEEAAEEQKMKEFRKEFGELPLEKKVANLLELEMVTLGETFNFVLNSPYKIVGKIMDVMAEFGMKQETDEKKARRPAEHAEDENERATDKDKSDSKKKNQARKKANSKKDADGDDEADDSPDEK